MGYNHGNTSLWRLWLSHLGTPCFLGAADNRLHSGSEMLCASVLKSSVPVSLQREKEAVLGSWANLLSYHVIL